MSQIRLSRSVVGEDEIAAVSAVIRAGYLGMGEEVRRFEEDIQAIVGQDRHVVCVATGTAALHLAAACLDLGPGDEVLVPTITYVASFQAIAATGATPVACDVHPQTLAIDLDDAAGRITPATRAIMSVHYASDPGERVAINAFAKAHGLRVIEDAAHSFGGTFAGAPVGSDGDIQCFSFDGIKNITAGEGGAVVTGDAALAARLRDARLLGVEKDTEQRYAGKRSWDFDVKHVGFRYHMSNIMAAIGRAQLRRLPEFAAHRRALALRYVQALAGNNLVRPLALDHARNLPHIFVVRVGNGARDALRDTLLEQGIESGIHYKPNHLLTLFYDGQPRPVAEAAYAEILTLPLHAALTDAEQDRVVAAINAFCADAA